MITSAASMVCQHFAWGCWCAMYRPCGALHRSYRSGRSAVPDCTAVCLSLSSLLSPYLLSRCAPRDCAAASMQLAGSMSTLSASGLEAESLQVLLGVSTQQWPTLQALLASCIMDGSDCRMPRPTSPASLCPCAEGKSSVMHGHHGICICTSA